MKQYHIQSVKRSSYGYYKKLPFVSLLAVCLVGTSSVLAQENNQTGSVPMVANTSVNTLQQQDTHRNLLENGDFEQTKSASGKWSNLGAVAWEDPWIPSNVDSNNGKVTVEQGKLKIFSTKSYRVAVSQAVTIKPNQQYKLTYHVKTNHLSGSGVRVRLRSLDEAGNNLNPFEATHTNFVSGDNDKEVEKIFSTSSVAKKLKVELFFENSVGEATFDNVSLTEYVAPSPKPDNTPPVQQELETGVVTIGQNKTYFPKRPEYTYQVENASIAKVENGMIYPISAGQTTVKILDNHKEISQFQLKVNAHQTDVFDQLRQNWEKISLGNTQYDATNVFMKDLLQRLESGVDSSLKEWVEPTTQSTTIFKDIPFTKSSDLTKAYRRLEQMAQIVENPSSRYYHNKEVVMKVRDGMKWLYEHVYNENKTIDGNWWDYEIGTPRAIVNTLIYMHAYFSQDETNQYTQPISKFVPDTTMIRKTLSNPVPAVGGNQTDISKVAILEGALRQDKQRVKDGAYGLTTIMKFVDSGEGFYKDGSFIDHTNVAYTGAYGNVLMEGFSQLLPVIQSTEFALPEKDTAILYEWIEKAFMPIIVRGELMDMTRGRSISRATGESHVQAVEVLRSLLRIAETADKGHQVQLKSFVKGQVMSDTYHTIYRSLKSYTDIALVNRLLADDTITPRQEQDSISAFNHMDKFVYHNAKKSFSFALSMYSDKTQNYEDMNNENRHGWHTSDGMAYLYNGDLSHYSDHYWATVDPYRLPGTTVTNLKRQDGDGETTLPSQFVGANQLGNRLATIAMDFTNWDKTLSERKAWMVLGDKIVFLGTGVQSQGNNDVTATIENRKLLENKNYTYYINGKPVDLTKEQVTADTKSFYMTNGDDKQSIGYAFLTPLKTYAQVETREGKWSDINYGQSQDVVSNVFMTLRHHPQNNQNYAYVLVPNGKKEEVEKVADTVKVLRQEKDLQVVYDTEQQVWGIVKYTDAPYQVTKDVTVTKAGVYTIKAGENNYQVSYYNPLGVIEPQNLSVDTAYTVQVEKEPSPALPSIIWKVVKKVSDSRSDENSTETTMETTTEIITETTKSSAHTSKGNNESSLIETTVTTTESRKETTFQKTVPITHTSTNQISSMDKSTKKLPYTGEEKGTWLFIGIGVLAIVFGLIGHHLSIKA